MKQLKKCEFDDTELCGLGPSTFTAFIFPRLEAFAANHSLSLISDPKDEFDRETNKKFLEFNRKLKLAVEAFRILHRVNVEYAKTSYSEKEEKLIRKGLKAFGEIYLNLWA